MDISLAAKRIIEFLDKNKLIYTYNEDGNFFSIGFKLTGKLQNVNLFINLGEDDYVVNAILPLRVNESSYADISLLFSAINFRLRNGAFTLDLSDGSLQYKVYERCYAETFSDQQILDSMMLPVAMVDQHSEFILPIIFNTKTISDVLAEFNSTLNSDDSENPEEG